MWKQRKRKGIRTNTRVVFLALLLLTTACEITTASRHDAVERVRTALETVRFVAYTPTDLSVINGQVRPASKMQIRKDLSILREDFTGLVLYSCADGLEEVPAIASELGYQSIVLGIWDPQSELEMANAIGLARRFPQLIIGVAVGNETLLAQRLDWPTLRQSIHRLRAALPTVAITTSEPFYYYLNEEPADFLTVQDFLLPGVHPLFEPWFSQASTETAVAFVLKVAARLSAKTDKPLLIKETGLPSGPIAQNFTPARQAEFWVTLTQGLPSMAGRGLVYFEAFDHTWKVKNAEKEFGLHPEEAFWGLYTEDGNPKLVMEALRRTWHAAEGNL